MRSFLCSDAFLVRVNSGRVFCGLLRLHVASAAFCLRRHSSEETAAAEAHVSFQLRDFQRFLCPQAMMRCPSSLTVTKRRRRRRMKDSGWRRKRRRRRWRSAVCSVTGEVMLLHIWRRRCR